MKKTLKMLLILGFAIILFSMGNEVEANSIQSINMNIFVDDNGDAYVTETWECNATEGTEVYHPYYNLKNSEIKNLIVSEGSSQYTTLSSWDSSGTLLSKANKCGINKIRDGVELCWGISKYGSHTYTVKYTITNFVSETTDSQMIYSTLIPYDFSIPIGNMYIKIYTDFKIEDTIDVWGYGNYGGTVYVYDGYIEMQSDGALETDEYMAILVKFPLGTFNTANKLNGNFEYYYEMAEENSKKYKQNSLMDILLIIVIVVIPGLIFIAVLIYMLQNNKFDYGSEGKKIPKDVPYFREIPFEKDIFKAYYIGYRYGIIEKKTDLLGAIILKWCKDDVISIEEKGNVSIILKEANIGNIKQSQEIILFKMLCDASKDGYLEDNEFEKWCQNNYSQIISWFDTIIKDEERKLIKEGLIREIKNNTRRATPELKRKAIQLAGLKKYLKEYTRIKERETIEVELFEDYLIFAQIMGIANKVSKQFKDIYPEIITQSNFTSYDYILFIHTSSYKGISAAESARQIAISRASNYSAGGGGFSSRGGGGGSFGGGGGGRRFPLKLPLTPSPW